MTEIALRESVQLICVNHILYFNVLCSSSFKLAIIVSLYNH